MFGPSWRGSLYPRTPILHLLIEGYELCRTMGKLSSNVSTFGMSHDRGHHHYPRFRRFLRLRKAKNAKPEVVWSRDLHGNGTNR